MSEKTENTTLCPVAYFITPHGFGHASRATAIMNAAYDRVPGIEFHIFTQVPRWLFEDTLTGTFHYHSILTDVGLVQADPLHEDLPATLSQLQKFYPLDQNLVHSLADLVLQANCQAVLCDVAPLGIAVAKASGIPSVLIENFTWDWIYQGYQSKEPRLSHYISYLQNLFSAASYHIQTTPACEPQPVDLVSHVVSRQPRTGPTEVRRQLSLPDDSCLVLITMGGIQQPYQFLQRLAGFPKITFIVPGAADQLVRQDNLILLPHRTPLFHPDLVHASNLVVGKVGYSTLGEVYHAGIPFAYVPRPNFPEMPPLVDFIRQTMPAFEIQPQAFMQANWTEQLPEWVNLPRIDRQEKNGAEQIARWLKAKLSEKSS